MYTVAQNSTQNEAPLVCQACSHVSTRFEPVRIWYERVSGDQIKTFAWCADFIMCAHRWDLQHGFGLTEAVAQQLATRERAGAA